ncbi:MAG: metallophosphoesterase [Planctomycetaceae bacterium]
MTAPFRDSGLRYDDSRCDRRRFLARVMIGGAVASAGWPTSAVTSAADQSVPEFAFVVIGDTHYLANRERTAEIDSKSSDTCGRLVDTINRLAGSAIPDAAGGGQARAATGVIHAGDVIDTGDKIGATQIEMQKTELTRFRDDFGLTGKDGRLTCPVFEIAGNHDSPHGGGLFIEQIKERNKSRPGVVQVSDNGVHYSWDWNGTHFVNLGLIVGTDATVARRRRYAALDSLAFLISDLKRHVGDSGKPVVLTHHVDVARYTGPCDPSAAADSKEWDSCDVQAFHEAIKGYNVVGIFYGHTHSRSVFRWDGESTKAKSGIRVFNTDNASHFNSDAQAFFYVESHVGKLRVREYQTKDRWQTGFWTPQVWNVQ